MGVLQSSRAPPSLPGPTQGPWKKEAELVPGCPLVAQEPQLTIGVSQPKARPIPDMPRGRKPLSKPRLISDALPERNHHLDEVHH